MGPYLVPIRKPSGDKAASVAILGDVDCSHLDGLCENPLLFLKPVFDEADIVIANVETVISDKILASDKPGIKLKSPDRLGSWMREAGIHVALLANNHIDDYGQIGVDETCRCLADNGILFFGLTSRNDIVLEKNGLKFRLSGFGTPWQDQNIVPSYGVTPGGIIRRTAPVGEHWLYFVHGFEELYSYPCPWRIDLLREISKELKPAALICGHAHVYQGWTSFFDVPVCLSYGNGLMNIPYHTQQNPSASISCVSVMDFDSMGCYQIRECFYRNTPNGLGDISVGAVEAYREKISCMVKTISSPADLQKSWDLECCECWKPRGFKNLPLLRQLYDWRRGIFNQHGVTYVRSMKAAYAKCAYGRDILKLDDGEKIRVL